jgi:hypothetical protein
VRFVTAICLTVAAFAANSARAHGATGVLAANVSGITINAGANDVVSLRGLEIDGGGSGANGILFTAGAALNIEGTVIRGFATGIGFQPANPSTLSVASTTVLNNTTGVAIQGSAATNSILNDVQLVDNATGLSVAGGSSTRPAIANVQNTLVANNSTDGVLSGGYSSVFVNNSTIANNGVGPQAQSTGALLQVSGSTVAGNGTGWAVANGGQVISSRTSAIGGNAAGNSASPTSPTPPPSNYLVDNSGAPLVDTSGNLLGAS